MTEAELVREIKVTGKFPKTFDDYTNFVFFMFPVFFIFLGFIMIQSYFKFHSGFDILFISVLFISLGFLFGFFIYVRLQDNLTFKIIFLTSKIDINKIAEILQQNFKLDRIRVNEELNEILGFTKWTAFSWGEQLTLVLDEDRILINSRPSGTRQPLTIIKDRQNIKKIKGLLYDVCS